MDADVRLPVGDYDNAETLVRLAQPLRNNMLVKKWHHTSLAVKDIDSAIAFYRDAFGFQVILEEREMMKQIEAMTDTQGLSCDLVQLQAGFSDHVLELISFKHSRQKLLGIGEKPIGPGAAHIAFYVEDLASAIQHVESLGAKPVGQVTRFDEGQSVYYREPGGSFLEIEQISGDAV